jgi:hypothetical protein
LKNDVRTHKDLPGVVENVVAGEVLARVEEGNSERSEDVTEVMVAMAGDASAGADKPLAEKMLRVLVVVTVMVATSISVEFGERGETMFWRSGMTRVRHEQTSSKSSVMNSILSGDTVGFRMESNLISQGCA